MYSFQFMHETNSENSIFVFAHDYDEAVKKIKAIGIPNFKMKEWILNEIIEVDDTIEFELE